MSFDRAIRAGVRRLFRLPVRTRDLARADADAELDAFLEERIDYLVQRGMAPAEARVEAIRRLGGTPNDTQAILRQSAEHRERRLRIQDAIDDLRADTGFALRALRRSPGWTAVALLTIALGVGATTTTFGVADALLLRPITYPGASRVYVVRREVAVGKQNTGAPISLDGIREWHNARTIEAVEPFHSGEASLGLGPDTVTVQVGIIDRGFLAFAGAHPVIGRNFTADEMVVHGPAVILLSEPFWRRQYGGSRDVLGKVVHIDSLPVTIVGVVPASLALPDLTRAKPDVWAPLAPEPGDMVQGVAVRLTPGVSPEAATGELAAIVARSQIDSSWWRDLHPQLRLTRPQDRLGFRHALTMLIGAVVLLMLVASTNVAHLLLARATARQRELAIRYALGAGRRRLLRQLITESVILAMMGGALAVFVGWAGLHLLTSTRPARLVALSYVTTHRGTLAFTSILAIAIGLSIGVISGLRSAQGDLAETLRVSAPTGSRAGRRLRSGLVIGEVALSAMLLVGALILIHAVVNLQRTPLGFDARGLYTVSFYFPENEARASRLAFATALQEKGARIPGAEGVTMAAGLPIGFRALAAAFETAEHPGVSGKLGAADINLVAPDYFSVMGMRLIAGRTFDPGSVVNHEVIISQTLARLLWPNGAAIGHRFRNVRPPRGMGDSVEAWQTVIGVAPDIVDDLLEGSAPPEVYRPLGSDELYRAALVVRLQGKNAPSRLAQFAKSVEANQSRTEIENVRGQVARGMEEPRFTTLVLVVLAVLGVLLAAVGLFGVISYSVGQRTREIGVRMTFGATRARIARLVVGEGIVLALCGIVLGLVGAVSATHIIQHVLPNVSRFDPVSLGAGAIVLLGVSLAACIVPMMRATGVDPVIAVRAE
jgi:putative ABC transport system permease protein